MSKDPKAKQDVLDPELSKRLAWRIDVPEAAPEPPKPPPPPPRDPDAEDAETRERTKRFDAFERRILAVWAMGHSAEQREATRLLLRQANRFGLEIACLTHYPSGAIRLLRLVARHARELKLGESTAFTLSFIGTPLGHPEFADFVVEATLSGNRHLMFGLELDLAPGTKMLEGKHPTLGKRLVEVFETNKDRKIRATALRLLSIDDFPDALPTLQKALRLPDATMRYYALHILEQMKGPALRPEDMQWLLDDAVEHPLCEGMSRNGGERIWNYEKALTAALVKCPPPDGWKPLEAILDGRAVYVRRDREGLDKNWALETLAAAYPERALRYVDHDLIAPDVHVGYNLVNAVGRLPAEWARPRLLHMSADIRWSEDAVKKWFALFGNECPVDPLAHVPQELLVGPPSERMLANLTALRGSQKEARHALLEVLWRDFPEIEMPPETLEPHQRESLALLMYVFRSERVMYGHPTLGRMSIEDWTVFFLKRGGRGAFEVLARWAEDGIRVGVHRGWLVILASHKVVTLLDTEQLERIRAIARIGLERPCMSSVSAAASIFRGLRAPLDLGGRLLENVWCEDGTIWGSWLAEDAARALTKMGPSPELDEAIMRDLEKAWELRRVKVCRRLIMAVCERQVSWALEMLMERIRGYQGAEDVREIVGHAFDSLYWAKRIDTEMMATILADGDHPLFSMAAGNVVKGSPPEWIEILFGHLDSPAQGGAVAGEALSALLRSHAIPLADARIERILAIAPLAQRVDIGDVLLMDKVPLARVYEHMKAGLLSEDERIWGPLLDMFLSRRPKGMAGLFEEVLPRIKSKMLRTVMQRELGLPEDAARYWKDEDDEDDEDDEEPEEDDDDMEDDDEDERLGESH